MTTSSNKRVNDKLTIVGHLGNFEHCGGGLKGGDAGAGQDAADDDRLA
jgi:hypothetical protein